MAPNCSLGGGSPIQISKAPYKKLEGRGGVPSLALTRTYPPPLVKTRNPGRPSSPRSRAHAGPFGTFLGFFSDPIKRWFFSGLFQPAGALGTSPLIKGAWCMEYFCSGFLWFFSWFFSAPSKPSLKQFFSTLTAVPRPCAHPYSL